MGDRAASAASRCGDGSNVHDGLMSVEASAADPADTPYDTAGNALGRRSVELVRRVQDDSARWIIRLMLAGQHHEVTFAGLKSRPLDLPVALSRHLVGFTGGEELAPVRPSGSSGAAGSTSLAQRAGAPAALSAMLRHLSDQLLVGDLAVRLELPDAIHQLRVTCRSLRALLKAAAPFLERSRRREASQRLKTLARVCAPARDAEITAQLLTMGLDSLTPVNEDLITHLQELAFAQYTEGSRAVRQVLQQKEHHDLLTEMSAFALNPPLTDKVTGLTARQLANKLLRRSLRGVLESAAEPPDHALSSDEAVLQRAHNVRKAAKAVRYVASVLHGAGIKPQKDLHRAAKTSKRYQRELGAIIDSWVVLRWLSSTADRQAGEGDRYDLSLIEGVAASRHRDNLRHSEELIDEFLSQLADGSPAS